jgi:hypothetical protein
VNNPLRLACISAQHSRWWGTSRNLSRLRPTACLTALMLLSAAATGSSTAAAPSPALCSPATRARWHIKHYHYTAKTISGGTETETPASGDRYHVIALRGSADCRTAHGWMHRLTSTEPNEILAEGFDQTLHLHLPLACGSLQGMHSPLATSVSQP